MTNRQRIELHREPPGFRADGTITLRLDIHADQIEHYTELFRALVAIDAHALGHVTLDLPDLTPQLRRIK